jgi:hypothetical protein
LPRPPQPRGGEHGAVRGLDQGAARARKLAASAAIRLIPSSALRSALARRRRRRPRDRSLSIVLVTIPAASHGLCRSGSAATAGIAVHDDAFPAPRAQTVRPMKILFLLAHASESVRARYQAALGPDVRLVPFVAPALPGVPGGGLSARYEALGRRLRTRSGGPVLPGLIAFLGLGEEDTASPIVFAWFSSGYALARELAASPEDRGAIAGWVGLDGGHAAEERDGSPADRDVAWLAELCREAAAGRTVLAYGHSDLDPIRYASTRETIDEALRLARLAEDGRGPWLVPSREACPGCRIGTMGVRRAGSLLVEAHDHRMDPVQEHVSALTNWGADLAARSVGMVRARNLAGEPLEQNPCFAGQPPGKLNDSAWESRSSTSIGGLAMQAALAELNAGAREEGENGGPYVRKYLSGCERGGRKVGITSSAWCAAFVGWCDHMAQRALEVAGEPAESPCRWRAAVWELVADAKAAGAWREAAEYSPLPGDLAVFRRDGQDPRRQGHHGHVGRVETAPNAAGAYLSIEGNSGPSGDRVVRVKRSLGDDDLVGWISYALAK